MKNEQIVDDAHGQRITALEEALGTIKNNITELGAAIRESRLASENDNRALSAQLATIGKANYPLYIAGVSLSITLIAAILYPFVQNIRKLEESDMRHSERTAKLETMEAVSDQRLKVLEERRP